MSVLYKFDIKQIMLSKQLLFKMSLISLRIIKIWNHKNKCHFYLQAIPIQTICVCVQVKGPADYSNFDHYPKSLEVPPDELSGWDADFWKPVFIAVCDTTRGEAHICFCHGFCCCCSILFDFKNWLKLKKVLSQRSVYWTTYVQD